MEFQPARVTIINKKQEYQVVKYYFLNTFRIFDNFGLKLAIETAQKNSLPLEIYYSRKAMRLYNSRQKERLKQVLKNLESVLKVNGYKLNKYEQTKNLAQELRISDFPYLKTEKHLIKNHFAADIIVESNIFVPVRIASDKAEYAARTIRPKINQKIANYIENPCPIFASSIDPIVEHKINDFCNEKLINYLNSANPNFDYCSNLSGEMAIGTVPLFKLYQKIKTNEVELVNKEAFFEQLIVRRELAINHCFYVQDYDTLGSWMPNFARENLFEKQVSTYTFEQLITAKTKDPFWNLAQQQLIEHGHIQNYMRMYWGKKIIEWTNSYQAAHHLMIKLNNQYAYDGNCPNSYTGINWCFGLHDRPFQKREWFGTIRYMNAAGIKRKFKNLDDYENSLGLSHNSWE